MLKRVCSRIRYYHVRPEFPFSPYICSTRNYFDTLRVMDTIHKLRVEPDNTIVCSLKKSKFTIQIFAVMNPILGDASVYSQKQSTTKGHAQVLKVT